MRLIKNRCEKKYLLFINNIVTNYKIQKVWNSHLEVNMKTF